MPPIAAGLSGCFDFGSMYSSGMLSATDLGTCPDRERDEPPSPGDETDGPVQVSVRNDSDAERRVTVTIEDGSRLAADWRVCKHTDDLVVIVSSGGGLGFERPE